MNAVVELHAQKHLVILALLVDVWLCFLAVLVYVVLSADEVKHICMRSFPICVTSWVK